jgi:hypothetical protein
MGKQVTNKNAEVTSYLDGQNHPLRNEIELLRNCILSASNKLTENIKWNGPNYCWDNEDRITMKIHPPRNIQLIFHRGAKKREQPKEKLIKGGSNILAWKENDRAVATFKDTAEIVNAETDLIAIVRDWIKATS